MNAGDQVRIKRTGETGEIVEVFGEHIWVREHLARADRTPQGPIDAPYSPLPRWWFEASELTVITQITSNEQDQGCLVSHLPGTARINNERTTGRHDEDELEASAGRRRRWYQLRPEPRRRSDFMGLNSTWWMVAGWVVLLLVLIFNGTWWW